MRSFKKALTMALVFVMAIGLLSVSALDFTDAADVQYAEAVEVMTNLGAINGYPDGTFGPDGLVTRAEAAKLVTYAILTPRVAEYLPSGSSSFNDVPANHWAAPYIEYCVSQGIVAGRGNGVFDPNGNVTAFELGKMLLTAAGYGKNNEYVGASWSLNVVTDAIDNDLFVGTKATNYGAPATREEAALYVFNGLTNIDQVVYSKDKESYEYRMVDNARVTIGEQKYGLDVAETTVNGVDGYVWVDGDGNELSSFVVTDNVLGTSMYGVSVATLEAKSKTNPFYIAELSTTPAPVFYVNGTPVKAYDTSVAGYGVDEYFVEDNEVYVVVDAIEQGEAFDTEKVQNLAATKGVIVNFVDNAPEKRDGKADKITMIHKSVYTLSKNPSVAKDGKVHIEGITDSAKEAVFVPGYEDLAKGDVVLWYQDDNNVYRMEKADSVTGKITAKKSSGDIVFGGETYKKSGLVGDIFEDLTYNVDSVAYLDNAGNIVAITAAGEAPTPTYVVLLGGAKIEPSGWVDDDYYEAKLLFLDGTTKVVTWAKVDGDEVDDEDLKVDDEDLKNKLYNKFYTYKVNAQGGYELTAVTEIADGTGAITPNKAQFDGKNVGNANTVFILDGSIVGKLNSYVVYKGIANVPKLDDTTATSILTSNGIAQYVFVHAGALADDTDTDKAYFVDDEAFTYYPEVGSADDYYEFEAIVDGELTTVKVATDLVNEKNPATDEVKNGLYEVTYTNGIITAIGTKVTKNTGIKVVGAAGGIILLGDEAYTYNDNTVVFYISTKNVVTEGTVASISAGDNDEYTVILVPNTDDLASVVIIREIAE